MTLFILAPVIPFIVIFFIIKTKRINIYTKGIISGGIFGLGIWLYDYDFLLNPGGPSTVITDYIKNIFGFSPFLILIIGFAALGFMTSIIIKTFKK